MFATNDGGKKRVVRAFRTVRFFTDDSSLPPKNKYPKVCKIEQTRVIHYDTVTCEHEALII
jgi:hypothetical protein